MKFRWDNRYLHWGVTAFLVIAASMLFYYGIFHVEGSGHRYQNLSGHYGTYHLRSHSCLYFESSDQFI